MERKLSILIPAFNEEGSIGEVVRDLKSLDNSFIQDIIVINDGSSDQTGPEAKKNGATVIEHYHNEGYGAALKTGIRSIKTEYFATFDADGQHKTKDLLKLIDTLDSQDMIVGARDQVFYSPLWRMPGKWCLGKLANYLTKRKIPDLNSGLRIVKTSLAAKYMYLCPSGFSFSTTISLAFICQELQVTYFPIKVNKRKMNKSQVSFSTGLDTIVLIIRLVALFNPLKVFLPTGFALGTVGWAYGIYKFLSLGQKGLSIGALLLVISSLLIIMLGIVCDQISQLRLEKLQ